MSAVPLSAVESLLNLWADNALIGFAVMALAVIVAWRLLFLSRIRIVQDRQQNAQIAADVARARMQLVVRQSNYRDKGVA